MKWQDIKGYKGKYQINKAGIVKNKSGYILKQHCKNNTPHVCLSGLAYKVSSLVLEAFSKQKKPENGRVYYKDGDHKNIRLNNLKWITYDEWSDQNWYKFSRPGKRPKTRKAILQIDMITNKVIKRWDSATAVLEGFKKFGYTTTVAISYCLTGKRKRAYGYKWKYADEVTK